MRVNELAALASITPRAIRKKTKKAIDNGEDYIVVGEDKYKIEILRGKVYTYTKIPESLPEDKDNLPDFSQKLGNNFLRASETAKNRALLKCRLVEAYLNRDEGVSTHKFLKELNHVFDELDVTEPTLFRWTALYKKARDQGLNPAEFLLDKRGMNSYTKLTDEMKEMALRMFLSRKRTRSKQTIYEDMKHHFGKSLPSYTTLVRFLERWKREHPLEYAFAKNPDDAKNRFMMSAGSYSEGVKAKNQVWELDSTPADIITSDGKRWTVLGAIDVATRRAVFHLDERSSSYSIARLLRKAILKFGVPDSVVTDNGKDYTSNHFAAICQSLGIQQKLVPPFSGDAKPHIERVFRTLSGNLFESLEGYIGHNVAERSALQAQRSFEEKQSSIAQFHKMQKKSFQDAWKFKKENLGLELRVTMTGEELAAWIDKWNERVYEQRRHSALGMSPIEKWNANPFPAKQIPDPRMLDILLGEQHIRKVGKQGIRIDNAHYVHERLIPYVGQYVRVMTPEDYGYILVYTEDLKPICVAEAPELIGKSRVTYKNIKTKSKQLMRQLNKMLKEWEKYDEYDPNIKTRIEEAKEIVEAKTQSVRKATPTIDAVLEASKVFEKQDKEDSNTFNMQGKKVIDEGKRSFHTFYDRFLYELEHDTVSDKTKKLAQKHPEMWELAVNEHNRRKAS